MTFQSLNFQTARTIAEHRTGNTLIGFDQIRLQSAAVNHNRRTMEQTTN